MKSYLSISFVILSLFVISSSQQMCQKCYDPDMGSSYQCNGKQCQGFLWPANISKPFNIQCKQSSSNNCYYIKSFDSTGKYFRYIACNYTFQYCSLCNENNDCQSCYRGSYSFYSNINNSQRNCKKCNQNINGCQVCSDDGSTCDQCSSKYILLGSLCYQTDRKTLAGGVVDNSSLSLRGIQTEVDNINSTMKGIQVAAILAVVFIGIGLIFFIYGVCNWIKKSKYQPLLQGQN